MDDNENDNLSDMVSANVESNVGEAEERRAPDLPVIVQKTNREDVTDRFGKFEIKHELVERDDMRSTVSDTWSTDVLASDSEPPEGNQLERLEEVAEEMARQNLLGVQEVCEISETASDAWSTDVLASDTSERQSERLLELEQDDAGSVSSRLPDEAADSSSETGQGSSEMRSKDEDLGAVGGTSPGSPPEISSSFDRQSVRPKAVKGSGDSSIMRKAERKERHTHHGRGNRSDADPRQCVSDIVGSYDRLGDSDYCSNPRESTSFKYAEGRVGKVLQVLEGHFPEESSSDPQSHDDGSLHSTLASSVSTLVPEQCFLSPDEDMKPSAHDPNALIDLNESTESVHESGGLKLTDLQNQNFSIDSNRLSAAIELFDPLMQDNRRTSDASSLSSAPPPANPFNRLSYQDPPLRPKPMESPPPKIALKLNSLDLTEEVASKGTRHSPRNSSSEQDTDDSSINSGISTTQNGNSSPSVCDPVAASLTSQKAPEITEEDRKDPVKKKTSFFSSFKERLSKGTLVLHFSALMPLCALCRCLSCACFHGGSQR
ncbi:hypothetical protein CAPTEDRAFT_201765 [Capitella teleta]|uniref:Uncharacterized protein n=1 Tax=Capitella teleta TaxID=283909 RepID=R7UU58_CAPTE|nr:hypothetical protein CAPTEDRAFT_201765 [Capitella teleta]|eukprot:ELU09720.1 hypothetical protein CAPTEDRAFT_201765 [Capitella teleta]